MNLLSLRSARIAALSVGIDPPLESTMTPEELAGWPTTLSANPYKALHEAIQAGHLPAVKSALRNVLDPNVLNDDGEPPVIVAMKADRLDIVETLLADPRVTLDEIEGLRGERRFAPSIDLARLMRDPSPEGLDQYGTQAWPHAHTPLHWAMTVRRPNTVRWLLANGASPHLNIQGKTLADFLDAEQQRVEEWERETHPGLKGMLGVTAALARQMVQAVNESLVAIERRVLEQTVTPVRTDVPSHEPSMTRERPRL